MSAVAPSCRDCEQQRSHCHSTWIDHAGAAGECTDDDCRIGPEGHEHAAQCDEIGCSW